MEIKFYYQIDFIDKNGKANYINTFKKEEFEKAKENYNILTNALNCLKNTEERFVLDLHAYIDDNGCSVEDTDTLIAEVIPCMEIML